MIGKPAVTVRNRTRYTFNSSVSKHSINRALTNSKRLLLSFVLVVGLLPQQLLAQVASNSALFDSTDGSYLSKTFTSAGNRKTWTWSAWVKRGKLGRGVLFAGGADYLNYDNDQLYWHDQNGTADGYFNSEAGANIYFRDPSSWQHIVLTYDSTNSYVKAYVDGVEVMNNATTQNVDSDINSATTHRIGEWANTTGRLFDGYLSDVHFIDGEALTPNSFGEADGATGKWMPKSYSGSYGINGFHLDFTDAADLGGDVSGGNNDFAANNLGPSSQVIDTPTNTFATLSSIANAQGATLSKGNLKVVGTWNDRHVFSTFELPETGKWYFEVTDVHQGDRGSVFIGDAEHATTSTGSNYAAILFHTGNIASTGTVNNGLGSALVNSDVIGIAYDADTGSLWAAKNEAVGGGAANVTGLLHQSGKGYRISYREAGSSVSTAQFNFGSSAEPGLTYYLDAGGYFKYEPPSGFKSLSSNNLPTTYRQYDESILYIDGDGFDASTTFVDESNGQHAVTANGDAQVDSAQNKFGGASMFFDGSGDYLSISDHTDFSFGTGDFTIDAWVRLSAIGVNQTVIGQLNQGPHPDAQWELRVNNANKLYFTSNQSAIYLQGSSTLSAGVWYHVAVVRSGTAFTLYLNGVSDGSITSSASIDDVSSNLNIGQVGDSYWFFNGWIDDLRVSKGTARWVSDFAPPTNAHKMYEEVDIIENPREYFDAVTYVGSGSSQNITGLNFQPDMVWLKNRDYGSNSCLFDSVRPLGSVIHPSATQAEQNFSSEFTAINPDGFSLGINYHTTNYAGEDYISWNWRESVESGFDIVSYTGDGSTNRSVGHDLGVVPELIFVKQRDSGSAAWHVYAEPLGATKRLLLDSTQGATTSSEWANTSPNYKTFTVNGSYSDVNANGGSYMAYLFASKPGFSKIGQYTGNGSADGPFVYTGFKPKYVLIKQTNEGVEHWQIIDSSRDSNNVAYHRLFSNVANSENTDTEVLDFTATGFKIRSSTGAVNDSSGTYIFYAIAEETNGSTVDVIAPQLSEIYAVPALTADASPAYSFYSSEAGTLQIGGSCSSAAVAAIRGDNTVILNLAEGIYNDCTITVTDEAGNVSEPLAISGFTIDPSYQYEITNALEFNSSNGEYLSWTPVRTGNSATWTWSAWVQRGDIGVVNTLLYVDDGSQAAYVRFNGANELEVALGDGSVRSYQSDLFGSSQAWTNLVLSVDTTQANAADRVKFYLNGQLQTPIAGYTDPQQNAVTLVSSTNTHYIGSSGSTGYFDGTSAEVRLIDGIALDASAFGEQTTQGDWVAVEYSSGGGSNSSYLNFENASNLGIDSAGDNDWQVIGLDSDSQTFATPSTPTIVGFTPGELLVGPGGNATYTIPIGVPAGIAGMKPELSVNYDSNGGNGPLGIGFSLGGMSTISRCPATHAQDGFKGGINFDANDRFCLDGQRLIAITGSDGGDGTEYRTEIDGHSKVTSYGQQGSGPSYWKVWTKSGQILEYGNTADSRFELPGKTAAMSWSVSTIADTVGNQITYTYDEDSVNGEHRLSRIDYGANSVRFEHEGRADVSTGYFAGSPVRNSQRISTINSYVGASSVGKYEFTYEQSGINQASRITFSI